MTKKKTSEKDDAQKWEYSGGEGGRDWCKESEAEMKTLQGIVRSLRAEIEYPKGN